MEVPGRWRPLKIDGTWTRGTMMIGRGADVVMQIKWWRPKPNWLRRTLPILPLGQHDPDRWLRRRLKAVRGTIDTKRSCPTPAGFEPVARAVTRGRRRRKAPCSLWYGWDPTAGVQIEAVVGAQDSGGKGSPWRALQSLKVARNGAPTTWALLNSSFHVPGGFVADAHKFLLGDLSIHFTSPSRETLMLRQIYPATLALERRTPIHWIEYSQFPSRRRFRGDGEEQNWLVESQGRRLEGLQRAGWKRYALPLGMLRARCTVGAVVEDTESDRLLVAEHDGPLPHDDSLVRQAILAMNRPAEGS